MDLRFTGISIKLFKTMLPAVIVSFIAVLYIFPISLNYNNAYASEDSTVLSTNPKEPGQEVEGRHYLERSILLGGEKYSKHSLIWDFLTIAISSRLTIEDEIAPSNLLVSLLSNKLLPKIDATKKNSRSQVDPVTAWISSNIASGVKLPRNGILNKWAHKKLTVGTGWPFYGEMSYGADNSLASDPQLKASIKNVVEKLNERTKFSFRIIDHGGREDMESTFARIRIIPVKNSLYNKYKFSNFSAAGGNRFGRLLVGAVPFTTGSRSQVQGFFLPDENSNISFAACYVSVQISAEMQRALINECLLRSLGLPEMTSLVKSALLGRWNSDQEAISKIAMLDGPSALDNVLAFKPDRAKILASYKSDEKLSPPLKKIVESEGITDFDLFMLNTLYCEDLKPGMDKLTTASVLVNSPMCRLNF